MLLIPLVKYENVGRMARWELSGFTPPHNFLRMRLLLLMICNEIHSSVNWGVQKRIRCHDVQRVGFAHLYGAARVQACYSASIQRYSIWLMRAERKAPLLSASATSAKGWLSSRALLWSCQFLLTLLPRHRCSQELFAAGKQPSEALIHKHRSCRCCSHLLQVGKIDCQPCPAAAQSRLQNLKESATHWNMVSRMGDLTISEDIKISLSLKACKLKWVLLDRQARNSSAGKEASWC